MMVGLDTFELAVEGGGGHSGIAHQERDAVFAAAQLVTALQSIAARETSPADTLVLTIASIQGGTAANVVAGTVPVLRCSETSSALLADVAAAAGSTVIDPGVIPASEDFAHLSERVPAAFIAIGAGGEGCGAHHAPDFDIDERSIGVTAEVLARAALTRLQTTS